MSKENLPELDPSWMVLLGLGLGATGGLLLLKRQVVLGGISLLTGAFLGVRGQEMRESGAGASAADPEPQSPPAQLEAAPAPSSAANGKEVPTASAADTSSKKGGTSGGEASQPKASAATSSSSAASKKSTSAPSSKAASKKADTPKKASASKSSGDDLRQVKGIGPKTVTILNAAGIRTFAELAAAGEERLTEILREAGLRLANPEGWPAQAAELAKG